MNRANEWRKANGPRLSFLPNSNLIINVLFFQRITATVNTVEQRRLVMDLDISMRSSGQFLFLVFIQLFII